MSVVVPTRHRDEPLACCLEQLAPGAQTLSADQYEVIVTDDGRLSTAQSLVGQQFGFARWIQGPRNGPAANRNCGAREARGEWLVFTDDDCVPQAQWLKAIADTIRSTPCDVIEGKTVCPDKTGHPFEEAIENLEGGVFWSCNLVIRRSAFEELGGFDEDFLEAGGEDMELAWRIRRRQLRTRFVPEALIVHPARRINWRGFWWRTLLMRWVLLYRLKTGQSPPLDSGKIRVIADLIAARSFDLAQATWHLVSRQRSAGRAACFFLVWKWLSFPLLLPYLTYWELRFRRELRD